MVNQQDIISTKKDLPRLLMLQGEYGAAVPHIFFGWLSPIFRDERVRRAMSMLIDRETFADVFSDAQSFRNEGVDLGIVYDNILGAGWGDFWLDPFGKDAGEAGQYFRFNIADAKKLLAAAGHSIAGRYEQRPTIITSNKSLTEWASIVQDVSLAAAVVDRVLHHGDVFYLKGPSWRVKDRAPEPGISEEAPT